MEFLEIRETHFDRKDPFCDDPFSIDQVGPGLFCFRFGLGMVRAVLGFGLDCSSGERVSLYSGPSGRKVQFRF